MKRCDERMNERKKRKMRIRGIFGRKKLRNKKRMKERRNERRNEGRK